MTSNDSARILRIWPGAVIVLLQWIATFGGGMIAPGTAVQFFGMMGGPLVGALLLFVWWLFASRAPWLDRIGGVAAILIGFFAVIRLIDPSMQMVIFVYGIPLVCLTFVLGAYATRSWPIGRRRLAMIATVLGSFGLFALLRSEGVRGDLGVDLAFRWSASAESRLLAAEPGFGERLSATGAGGEDPVRAEAEWPGFRGAGRDGVVSGVRIPTDWNASPPNEIWRRPVGPGWSSFAVAGNRLYTQEQRGEDEIVACYDAATGEPVWAHRETIRFWEPMAGTGPRATPTVHAGRVYALGATGILNALDAADGSPVWRRDAADDTGADIPEWGFASSPLIVDDLVIVHTGGGDGKAVVAYELETGEPRWFAPAGKLSYSSAHLTTIGGVRQVLVLTGDGITSLAPEDHTVLWEHAWPMEGGARIVQPAITDEGDVLIGTGFGMGLRRIGVTGGPDGWTTEERWTSKGLKPYFNDLVVHRGHAYGFDGRILSCVELASGERKWKGGRYGHGQLMLLADQDLLIVLSERGALALVSADPGGFSEIARMPAIEGKTWNHPVLVNGVLYVRNGKEMAAFRLL
jgi:outer membrane protein assembly factor BamB